MTTINPTIEEAIRSTNQAFVEAFGRGDAAGLATVYTVDGQVLPPNGETVTGRPRRNSASTCRRSSPEPATVRAVGVGIS